MYVWIFDTFYIANVSMNGLFSFVKFTEEKLEKLLLLVINLPVRKKIKGTA